MRFYNTSSIYGAACSPPKSPSITIYPRRPPLPSPAPDFHSLRKKTTTTLEPVSRAEWPLVSRPKLSRAPEGGRQRPPAPRSSRAAAAEVPSKGGEAGAKPRKIGSEPLREGLGVRAPPSLPHPVQLPSLVEAVPSPWAGRHRPALWSPGTCSGPPHLPCAGRGANTLCAVTPEAGPAPPGPHAEGHAHTPTGGCRGITMGALTSERKPKAVRGSPRNSPTPRGSLQTQAPAHSEHGIPSTLLSDSRRQAGRPAPRKRPVEGPTEQQPGPRPAGGNLHQAFLGRQSLVKRRYHPHDKKSNGYNTKTALDIERKASTQNFKTQ